MESAWTRAGDLRAGDELVLNDHRTASQWEGPLGEAEGYLLGLLIGDGTLKSDKAVLSVWAPDLRLVANAGPAEEPNWPASVAGIMRAASDAMGALTHRSDFKGWQKPIDGRNEFRLASTALRDLAFSLGLPVGHKTITPAMERGSSAFCVGVLRGLFDADGSVQGMQDKGVSVRLTQADESALQAAQRMLLRLGIASAIYRERHHGGPKSMPDGRGGQRDYLTQPIHELIISGENLARFADHVGFADTNKSRRLRRVAGCLSAATQS